ncbi:MAG: SpoIID/LytB domain-containing protein [Thermoanaerobaculia bacterium]
MKRTLVAAALLLMASCASAPPVVPSRTGSLPTAVPARVASASANAFTRVTSVSRSIVEPRIRVGLLTDQTSVTFPRIVGGYYLVAGTTTAILNRGFSLSPPLRDTSAHYGVQVGTLSDLPSATAMADKIRSESGQRVDLVFDPATGSNRIIAGDFPTTAAAGPLREQLTTRAFGKDMLIVRRPTDQPFDRKHRLVDDEGDEVTIDGESVLVMPVTAETVLIDAKAYRTAARVHINSRGLYNVINELNLEDYLRGVVPAEMGSKIYDEVEGLKAQAIAARTYAVRNLRQFQREGYDICPGPACQAYKGFTGEEPLSDQAVKETAGLVMTHQGKPIDALYTATCGGETSDVGVMFPGRNDPYLKRTRCVELELVSLVGRADSGVLTETQVAGRAFASVAGLSDSASSWSAADVQRAVQAASRLLQFDSRSTMAPSIDLAGGTPQRRPAPAAPASSRRGDVLVYLASVFGFDRYASVVTLPEDRRYFFPQSEGMDGVAYGAAAFLMKFGFLPSQQIDRADLNAAMPRDELYSLLGSWLRKHSALTETNGKILAINGRELTLKFDGRPSRFTLPAGIPIFRRLGDRYQEYRSVPVMIGDRAFLQTDARKTPVALIVSGSLDGASFDRTSSFADWTRSYRADELVTSINKRNPIQQLQGIRPLKIDSSQRIAELEVTAEGGRTFVLRGLPVRWSLNVPDNLFVYEKTTDPDGVDRYTFYGKGWGHGVGMCQVGAYGMAFRGWSAEKILTHYYTGIAIVPMSQVMTASAAATERP